jgi:formylglycine-generating enzyme
MSHKRRRSRSLLTLSLAAVPLMVSLASCHHDEPARGRGGTALTHGGAAAGDGAPAAPALSATSRPGMILIPAGFVFAGTPPDKTPRIADEELPWTKIAMGEFFIDMLPYPDEAGAIATTNVTRDEASALCVAKGKRLCTELEWERACKGPASTTYETGEPYDPAPCGLGVSAEVAAKRPTGDRRGCVSGFGVRELHGGAWEWTDGVWGRGGRKDLGVLKGGDSVAGEIAGRCANSLARTPSTKSPSMGFRCCAGARNAEEVSLGVKVLPPLERSMKTAELAAPWLAFANDKWHAPPADAAGAAGFAFVHAFTWHPVGNETLVVASGCARGLPRPKCGLLVARPLEPADDGGRDAQADPGHVLLFVDTGFEAAEVAQAGEARHLRFKGLDTTSGYLRDFTYAQGRIELGPIQR